MLPTNCFEVGQTYRSWDDDGWTGKRRHVSEKEMVDRSPRAPQARINSRRGPGQRRCGAGSVCRRAPDLISFVARQLTLLLLQYAFRRVHLNPGGQDDLCYKDPSIGMAIQVNTLCPMSRLFLSASLRSRCLTETMSKTFLKDFHYPLSSQGYLL